MGNFEKIKERKMTTFVLSSLINFGIGFIAGFIMSIVVIIGAGLPFAVCMSWSLSMGFLFAILELNMYRVYFYYRLSMDINSVCEGDGQETTSFVLALALSMVTFGLYYLYWIYKLSQRLRVNAPRYGFKMLETGKEIAVLSLLSFNYIAAWELIKNMNRVAREYNQIGLPEVVGGVQ